MRKLLLSLIGITIITVSCQLEDSVVPNNKLLIDPSVGVVDRHLKFENTSSFNDLLKQMHEQERTNLDKEFYNEIEKQGFRGLNKGIITRLKSGSLDPIEDTLVPDPYFAALLNDEREIEVNGVIYKITEYGTFLTAPE